jgi:DNA-binding NtrC family response regulator
MLDVTLAKNPPVLVSYPKLRVTVVKGPDASVVRDVTNSTLRVGSASDNDLVLTDDTVSRHHCAIEPMAQGVRIRDEGSTNGVFIGSLRIHDAVTVKAVDVALGDSVLHVEPLSEKVSREQLTSDRFGDLWGRTARMRELFADLARIAQTDVTLLVEGETGTGKELIADAIHRYSQRANRPFIAFDCSSVVSTLIESELFGSVPGAFNGAVNRQGVFEQAHGGTLFIDELGELPKDLQPKLLRVLERREVKRLGSERVKAVDVRVVSATNRNLAAEVQRGRFREDLYFRLATAQVHVPPLRDRMDDLPLLVDHFLARAKSELRASEISQGIWSMFMRHNWPGNVRELWNAVQRLLITPDRIFSAQVVNPSGIPASVSSADATSLMCLHDARAEATRRFEDDYFGKLWQMTQGNKKEAARLANVSVEMIRKTWIKLGLT